MRWWKKLKDKFKINRRPEPDAATNVGDALTAVYHAVENQYPDHRVISFATKFGATTQYLDPNDTKVRIDGATAESIASIFQALLTDSLANITYLDISYSAIDDKDVVIFMDALIASGKKRFVYLEFSDTPLGNDAACAIARAIEAGCFPDNFKLLLDETHIGDIGAEALAKAITHPNCPAFLDMSIVRNDVGKAGALAFHEALSKFKCKQQLKLSFYTRLKDEDSQIVDEIYTMAADYAKMYDAYRCLTFYKGLQDSNSPVSMLQCNLDVLPLIMTHVIPPDTKQIVRQQRRKYKKQHGTVDGFLSPHQLFVRDIHKFYKQYGRSNQTAQQEQAAPSPGMTLS